ncbi:uncharacterized protein LOC132201254 [Neocloeon triangulifer]|uniref:uncharacterized protein LOC132201254 n=1 Tax=Neocloeon triangulifer TaxID=2078957 RepID=UPI00286F0322|nr:uncharacterized protein LOC132201254 [Neocloeon triangulifer]XP_059483266.1 uncharacterized protein LOC132201254 [Neocloeon triangulifer]
MADSMMGTFWIFVFLLGWSCSQGLECMPGETVTFEKVTGHVPIIALQKELLHLEPGPQALLNECAKRCIGEGAECAAFVLDYHQSSCFSINMTRSDSPTLFTPQGVDYFEKVCFKGPKCGDVEVMVERVPGFELRALQSVAVLDQIFSRSDCAAACVTSLLGCRSALFDKEWGKCILIAQDRRSLPSAFVPSTLEVDYLENLCFNALNPSKQECSFEEFHSMTIGAADISLINMENSKCREMCIKEKTFICRGFTFEGNKCSLHSSDLASRGPESLIASPGATYFERAPCLDLLIRCSKNMITARLQTAEPFFGRIFVRGYSNICDVTGQGETETTLSIGSQCATFDEKQVGVSLVVQYNPILQRRGDRALNVSCGYGDSLLKAVNGSITVDGDPFFGGAISINSSSIYSNSNVKIVITDREGNEASVTEVGKELELRIIAINTDPFDVTAGKLIATNLDGTDSVLLLDERGCPPDPATFPSLMKDTATGDLVAHFRAFRFTNTTVVRFHVRVHFCQGKCAPVDCGSKGISYGRRRREIEGPVGRGIVWPQESIINPRDNHPHDLETGILVFGPEPIVSNPINLTSTESSTSLFTMAMSDNIETLEGWWCVSMGVFIGVLVAWILLQIILAVAIWTAATLYVQHASTVRLRKVKWQDDSAFD